MPRQRRLGIREISRKDAHLPAPSRYRPHGVPVPVAMRLHLDAETAHDARTDNTFLPLTRQ
jgi:hypothetical protein